MPHWHCWQSWNSHSSSWRSRALAQAKLAPSSLEDLLGSLLEWATLVGDVVGWARLSEVDGVWVYSYCCSKLTRLGLAVLVVECCKGLAAVFFSGTVDECNPLVSDVTAVVTGSPSVSSGSMGVAPLAASQHGSQVCLSCW